MATNEITRRTMLLGSAAPALSLAMSRWKLHAQTQAVGAQAAAVKEAPVSNEYRYGHMLQEYYVHRVRRIARERAIARAAIRTPDQVMKLRDEVRLKLKQCYGPLPERTPLNPHITSVVEREHYTIEKLIYESRPNYLVTANVYVPKGRGGRRPAVLVACGHTANGKVGYQLLGRNLARQGYVTLIYDPPSQGERLEYPDTESRPPIRYGVHSHNLAGNQMTLCGRCFALWEAWDGIRGLDYLLSRPDVDPGHIGVTGNSGGGTQTSHLTALDDRFAMAAPSCYVTRFRYNLENEEPTDAEQIVPGMLAAGLDMADFFVAQIPRPTLLLGQINDFFDVRGLRETYEELRRLYAIVGREKDIALYVGPNTHGYHQGARERMYRFFNKHAGVEGSPDEPDTSLEPDEVLQVTPGGQVHLMGSARTFDFTRQAALVLAADRKPLSGKTLSAAIVKHLALPPRSGPPHFRVMRSRSIWGNPRLTDFGFVVETEPRCVAMLHAIPKNRPSAGASRQDPSRRPVQYYFPKGKRATLYIPHRSSLQEMILGKAPEVPDENVRFALDLRGMGQLTARTHKDRGDDFFHYYHSDYMYSNYSLMLNEPYAGRRVHDLLRVLDLFAAHGYRDIHLVGRGMGAVTATFAAVIHPLVTEVTLHNGLLSYHELTEESRYAWPLSAMVFGILKAFDLPDCLRDLAARKKLTVVDPWDSRMQLWAKSELPQHLRSLGLGELEIQWEPRRDDLQNLGGPSSP